MKIFTALHVKFLHIKSLQTKSLHATSLHAMPYHERLYKQMSLRANVFARYLVCARILSLLVIYIIRLPYAGAISTAESKTLFNLN